MLFNQGKPTGGLKDVCSGYSGRRGIVRTAGVPGIIRNHFISKAFAHEVLDIFWLVHGISIRRCMTRFRRCALGYGSMCK
jgi:hypothetical protein